MTEKTQFEIDYFNANGVYPITEHGGVDLTEEQVAEATIMTNKFNAKQYLKKTDWYVTRKAETGQDIPDDVLQKRTEARQTASS